MKPKTKRIVKRFSYVLLALFLLSIVGAWGTYRYAMHRLFRDTPNTLTFVGQLHPVSFEWAESKNQGHIEPHSAILIPVTVPGISQQLYMQFDTGSPDTFLRSGALDSLKSRGVSFETFETDDVSYIENFEFEIGGNRLLMQSGWIRNQNIKIDWENPNSKNIIGSFGADFLDQKVCEIDFAANEIRLHRERSEEINALGNFSSFKFQGRRIILPVKIDGSDVEVFYDSGCSAFGLLTSKFQYDRLTNPNDQEISHGSNRHGQTVPIHHKTSDLRIQFGEADLSIKRVSYAELYNFLQVTIGRFVGGGFLGNKCLIESTLIIDANASEFLVIENQRPAKSSATSDAE